MDAKHQVVVRYGTTCRRPAFGDGSEAQHLESIIDSVEERFHEIDPETDIFQEVVLTADSGFNNEEAMKVLQDRSIDGYVADPQFRKRDPGFCGQANERVAASPWGDPCRTGVTRKRATPAGRSWGIRSTVRRASWRAGV